MNLTLYVAVAIGIFLGGILFGKDFRAKVMSMIFNKGKSAHPTAIASSGIQYYARDGGWHYHVKSCRMLEGRAFDEWHYKEVDAAYILNHHLKPDGCIDRRDYRNAR